MRIQRIRFGVAAFGWQPVRLLCIWLLLSLANASQGQRSSQSYSITSDTADTGGGQSSSGAYGNQGSVGGGVEGTSTVASPTEAAKAGFVGQLYQVTGLTVTSTSNPVTVDGGANVPLGAWENLDDGTYIALQATSVAWSVVSGPITAINSQGLAMAGAVSQNTAATVQGAYGGFTNSLNLTVDVPAADFTSATQTPIISDGYNATGSTINLALGFAPTTGTVLTVIDNTGTTPIQGTFSNLSQGQTVNLSYGGQTYRFLANYSGGTNGNNLVLQFENLVPVAPMWAVLTLGIVVMAIGARAALEIRGKGSAVAASPENRIAS